MGCVSKVTLWLSRSIPQRPHSRLRPRGQVTEKHRGLQRARIVLFLLCPTRHLASSLGFREYSLGKIPVAVGILCQLSRLRLSWVAKDSSHKCLPCPQRTREAKNESMRAQTRAL